MIVLKLFVDLNLIDLKYKVQIKRLYNEFPHFRYKDFSHLEEETTEQLIADFDKFINS